VNTAAIAAERLAAARRAVALAQPNNRLAVFQNMVREAAGPSARAALTFRSLPICFRMRRSSMGS
jgi:hypothetical protein